MAEEKLKKIGSIWKKKSKSGDWYYTGTLEMEGRDGAKTSIIMFIDKNKKNENSPDANIYLSTPRESVPVKSDSAKPSVPSKSSAKTPPKPTQDDDEEAEIPF